MVKSEKSGLKKGIYRTTRSLLPQSVRTKRRSSFTMTCKGRRFSLNWHCSPLYSVKRNERHLRTGFIYLQSSSKLNRTWKLYYAILYADRLFYTQQSKTDGFHDGFRRQQIKISHMVSLKVLKKHLHAQNQRNSRSNSKSNVLVVKFIADGKQNELLLRFHSAEEMNEWMTALLMAKSSSILGERTFTEKRTEKSVFYNTNS